MALDYSKLTDDELDAIANNDYSRLSDKTLRAIATDPTAKKPDRGFTAPLKEMSVEDWKKESIAYPVLQTMYGLLPFQGKQGEQAFTEGMAGVKQKGDAIVEGVKTIAQDPAAAAQAAWSAVTQRPGETLGNLVKGAVYDPELLFMPVPGAKQAGQAVGAVTRPVVQGVKNVGGAVADFTGGAVGRATGNIARPGIQPEVWQTRSSRQPAGATYHPPEDIAAWKAGEIPTEQVGSMPWTAEQQAALARTKGNVPYQGEVARAIGEQFVEPYTTWQGYIPDVALGLGGTMLGVGPVVGPALNMARRGYNAVQSVRQAGAMKQLGDVGLTPLYAEELAALQKGQPHPSAISGIGPVAGPVTPKAQPMPQPVVTTQPVTPQALPQLTYNPTQPVMYASESGIVGKTPQAVVEADLAQRYAPQPVAPVATEAVTAPAPAVTTQPVKPLTVESTAGKTAEQLAAEQQILDFINRKRGIVTGDPAATRANFANTIQQTRENLTTAREQNKLLFGDRAKAMNEKAGTGSMMPNPKDIIDDATAVRHLVNQTMQGAVKQQGKKVTYSEALINDFATQAGITLDWKTAPKITDMGVGEARNALNKWVFDSIDAQSPELGLKTRAPQLRTLQKQAEAEEAKRVAGLTAEQRAAEAAAEAEIAANLAKRQQLLGITSGKTAGTAPAGPSSALQAALDRAKAQGKYKPPGVMEMMTEQPSVNQHEPWLTKQQYDEAMFNRNMGFDKSPDFTAKTKLPGGNITTIESPKGIGERVDFSDKSVFTKIKDLQKNETSYIIENGDNVTKYILDKNGVVQTIQVKKGDRLLGEWNNSNTWSGEPEWQISHKNPDGSYSWITEYDTHLGADALKPFKKYNKMSQPDVVDKTIQNLDDKVKVLKKSK